MRKNSYIKYHLCKLIKPHKTELVTCTRRLTIDMGRTQTNLRTADPKREEIGPE